jgi:tRNA A-37 threonylcarbamoyl transferase component Bud32
MASTPRLQVGTIFAEDYRIVGPLAEGGMGSVYRAEQISTAKPRAVKVVHGRLLDDERSRMRFVREATVAASIASEHVVEVIAAGIDRTTELPYLVMELLEGGDLAAVVRHRGRFTTAELGATMRQLCHGLAAAHVARVIHRDLKPENIFVAYPRHAGTSFTVKILDFGIAKVTQESKTVATLTGTVGSPLWMAPEQINNEALGPQTDVWALGLLAFWALTGQSYWRTARADRLTIQALFAEQLFRELEPASVRAAEFGMADAIGPGFDDWFMHCVTRRPQDRFSDAAPAWAAFEQSIDAGMRGDITLLPPRGEVWESTSARMDVVESTISDAPSGPGADRSAGYGSGLGTTFGGVLTIANTSGELPTPPASDAIGQSVDLGAAASDTRRRTWLVPAAIAVASTLTLSGVAVLAWRMFAPDDPKEPIATVQPPDPLPPKPEPKPQPEPQPPGQQHEVPEIITPPVPDPPPLAASDEEHAAVALIRPMTTQPSFSAASIDFLGWSTDRARFVIEAEYPTHPSTDGLANQLRLVEVHDVLSGEMVGSFLVSRTADPAISERDRLARMSAEAEPKDDWAFAKDELGLVARAATGLPPSGLARIELSIKPTPSGSTITTEATAEGFAFRWTYGPPVSGAATATPHLVLHWTSGAQRWELLDVPMSVSPEELVAARPDTAAPVYAGTIALHWAPQAERIVVVIRAQSEPLADGTIFEPTRDARWFLRASGPQIRLVDGGAGQRKLRHAAWALQQAGLPIAAADLDHEDVEGSRVYVRARDPAAADLATQIGKALGAELPSAILDRAGWTQIVVTLGPDFGQPAPQ